MEFPTLTNVQSIVNEVFKNSELQATVEENNFYGEITVEIVDPKTKKYEFWSALPYRYFRHDRTYDLDSEIKTIYNKAVAMLPAHRAKNRIKRLSWKYRERFYAKQTHSVFDAKVGDYLVSDLYGYKVTKVSASGKTIWIQQITMDTFRNYGIERKANKDDKAKSYAIMTENELRYWHDRLVTLNAIYENIIHSCSEND